MCWSQTTLAVTQGDYLLTVCAYSDEPYEPGYEGFVDLSTKIMDGRNSKQQQESVLGVLHALMPPNAPTTFRKLFPFRQVCICHKCTSLSDCSKMLNVRCPTNFVTGGWIVISNWHIASKSNDTLLTAELIPIVLTEPPCDPPTVSLARADLIFVRENRWYHKFHSRIRWRDLIAAAASSTVWQACKLLLQQHDQKPNEKNVSCCLVHVQWTAEVNAAITQKFFAWLVGPLEVKEVEVQFEGKPQTWKSGVQIEKCRYLEQSGCKGMCINMCKVSTFSSGHDALCVHTLHKRTLIQAAGLKPTFKYTQDDKAAEACETFQHLLNKLCAGSTCV